MRKVWAWVIILLSDHVRAAQVIHALLQAVEQVSAHLFRPPVVRRHPVPVEPRACTGIREPDTVLPRDALAMLCASDFVNLHLWMPDLAVLVPMALPFP